MIGPGSDKKDQYQRVKDRSVFKKEPARNNLFLVFGVWLDLCNVVRKLEVPQINSVSPPPLFAFFDFFSKSDKT